MPAWLPCFKCRNASQGKGSSLDWQFWHLIKSWEQIRRTYTVSITFSFRKQIHCFCRYYLYWLWNLHILSGFCISIFIWNNKEITECILLCMFLCKDWLFQIFVNNIARIVLKLIPDSLQMQLVFLRIDDTMVSKFSIKFKNVSKLFDHAAHNGSN